MSPPAGISPRFPAPQVPKVVRQNSIRREIISFVFEICNRVKIFVCTGLVEKIMPTKVIYFAWMPFQLTQTQNLQE